MPTINRWNNKNRSIDLNTIKEYLNQTDFNDFIRCTKNKIFETTITQTASTSVNNKASATELTLNNSKKIENE